MDWTINKALPICRQIFEKFCTAIATGELQGGEKLPSVREVALLASVNPNTVQKSFEELERHAIIHSVPSSGWYVNQETDAAREELCKLRHKGASEYLSSMKKLGASYDAALEYLKAVIQERNDEEL